MMVAGAHGDVEREHVSLAIELIFFDGFGGKIELVADIEQVVIYDAHAEAGGGDFSKAAADAAHAEDGEGEFVELLAADGGAEVLELLGVVGVVLEEAPGAQELEHIADAEIADGAGVGIGRVDDLDAAFSAGGDVDVFQADAAAADDAEARGGGEEGVIDAGVSADDEAVGGGEGFTEIGVGGGAFDHIGLGAQPGEGLGVGAFGEEDGGG